MGVDRDLVSFCRVDQVLGGYMEANRLCSYDNPVNIMAPLWLNNSCSPFPEPNSSCTLGNNAVYAINIDGADTAKAGIRFARENNIRLSIKNTGHDYIGRSNGQGSLALWTHNLKSMSFISYSSPHYTGPALKAGAGVQFSEAYEAAAERGLRVIGGFCPSVGMVGGFVQSGGYGPLSSNYGLAADNALEFEVVTVDGQHLVASPTLNSDLYWALSGGGAGNYAVVLSLTTKAHTDGRSAGASLSFVNEDPESFWAAVSAFQVRLLELNTIPGFTASWSVDNQTFQISVATLADGTQSAMEDALKPFLGDLRALNVPLTSYNTTEHASFYDHFEYYTFSPKVYETNSSLGGRLIEPATIKNNLTELVNTFRDIVTDPAYPVKLISATTLNVTHDRVGNQPGSNAVLPAWRAAAYTLNAAIGYSSDTSSQELQAVQEKINEWQAQFNPLTPGGGGYMNEATYDDPNWKVDYFGSNYDRLLSIKKKYDPDFSLWQHTSVGSDVYWEVVRDGRLCRLH